VSIGVEIVVLEQPYGNPGSLGEPLGLWMGTAVIAGDMSGGAVELGWVPQNPLITPLLSDKRREHVYFCDGGSMQTLGSTSPGEHVVSYETHWAPANVALPQQFAYRFIGSTITQGTVHQPREPIYADYVARMPIFWEASQLGLISQSKLATMTWEVNNVANSYRALIYGRYYDRQILANRAFSRLVSPPAVSQWPR